MVSSFSFITRLKTILLADPLSRVAAALRQDPLVWDRLQKPEFGERALERFADRPADWSPANLALLALDLPRPKDAADHGAPAPLSALFPPQVRQRAVRAYENLMDKSPDEISSLLTLENAGLLAIALLERYRTLHSWEGLPADLRPQLAAVWRTPLACLYGLAAEPAALLGALICPAASEFASEMGVHTILSNPLPPVEQEQILRSLLSDLPLPGGIALLRTIETHRPSLAARLGRELLERNGKLPAATGPAEGGALATSPDQLARLVQLANLNAIAVNPTQAVSLRTQAYQTVHALQGEVLSQLVEDTVRSGDIDRALATWQRGLASVSVAPSAKKACPPTSLVAALLEAKRAADVVALFPEASSMAEDGYLPLRDSPNKVNWLVGRAQVAVSQGSLEEARRISLQALEIAVRLSRVSAGPKKDVSFDNKDIHALCDAVHTLSRTLLTLNMPAEAIQAEKMALAFRPNDLDGLATLSEAQRAAGHPDEAIETSRLSVALAPTRANLRRMLADHLESAGNWIAALEEREVLLAEGNAHAPKGIGRLSSDLRALATTALRAGQLQRSAEASRKAIELDPEDGLAHATLGEALIAQGESNQALDHFRLATQLAPHQSAPWLALARARQNAGESSRAIETLRAASQAVPGDPLIHLALAEAYLQVNAFTQALTVLRNARQLLRNLVPSKPTLTRQDNEIAARIDLHLGRTLTRLGHLKDAREVLSDAYQQHPGFPGLAYAYAQTLLSLDEPFEAITPLAAAVQAEPDEVEPYLDYAQALLATKPPAGSSQTAEAVRAARRALELTPGNGLSTDALARALLAEALAANNQPDEALPAYYRALETNLVNEPHWHARLSYGLGRVALSLDQPETAIAAMQEAARLDPQNAQIQRLLAETYVNVRLPKEALKAARNAVQLAPDDVDTLAWFAGLSAQLGANDEAAQALERAIQLEPANMSLLARMGQIQAKTGASDAAQEAFQQVMTAESSRPEDLHLAARSLLEMGDTAGAIAGLERALDLLPQPNVNLLHQLAVAYQQTHMDERALEILDRAIAIDPHNPAQYLAKADLLNSLGRPQAAQASLEHALNLKPEDPQLHYRLALMLRANGNIPEALYHAEQMMSRLVGLNGGESLTPEILTARTLAAELARAMLDPERACMFMCGQIYGAGGQQLDEELIEGLAGQIRSIKTVYGDHPPASDDPLISFLCLAAEFLLEKENQPLTDRAIAVLLELTSRSGMESHSTIQPPIGQPRILALQARQAYARGETDVANQFMGKALVALDQAGSLNGKSASAVLADILGVVFAAVDLDRYDRALALLERALDIAQQEPYVHLQMARALVKRAEYQQFCHELEVVTNAPGPAALFEAAYQSFDRAIRNAASYLTEEDPESLEKTHPLIMRWRLRGKVIFQPGLQSVQAMQALSDAPENFAARLVALYHADEMGTIIQLRKANLGAPLMQHPIVLSHLAIALGFSGRRTADLGDALEAIRKAVEQRPNRAMYHALLARLAYRSGDVDTSLQAIRTALSIWPDEPRWHTFLANLLVEIEQTSSAIEHLGKAIELEPRHLPHHMALGEAYLQIGEVQQALRVLEQAQRIAPQQIEAYLALARAYFAADELGKAASSAERAINLAPTQTAPLLLRAEIALYAEDARGALNRAQSALRINPGEVAALHMASQAYSKLDRQPQALAMIEKAIPLAADPLPLLLERIKLIEKIHGKDVAFARLQELAAQYPREPTVLSPLARALAAANQRDAAIVAAQQAFRAEELDLPIEEAASLHHLLAQLLRQTGQLDQAIYEFSEAIRLDPNTVDAYLELGDLYNERRQHGLALQTYKRAISVAANDPRPYYQAGMALKESRDYTGAEAMLRRAAELARDDVSIHRQLAAVVALNLVHNRPIPA